MYNGDNPPTFTQHSYHNHTPTLTYHVICTDHNTVVTKDANRQRDTLPQIVETQCKILDSHCCGHRIISSCSSCLHPHKEAVRKFDTTRVSSHRCMSTSNAPQSDLPDFSVGRVTGEPKTEATPHLSGALAVHDQCT
jgi:hypothetical protein